ncbi:MAG: response regulator transcription factor [Ktedonobacteraceae bacterium]|nr:response regulator transcription factor [Ktedonobacteraceae bacterium]
MRVGLIHYHLGRVAVRQHNLPRALELLRESCSTFHQSNQRIFLAGCLEALAALSVQLCSPQQGARWLGQAQSLYPRTPQQRSLTPVPNAFYEATVAALQELLTSEIFVAEFSRGEVMSVEQALSEIKAISLPEVFEDNKGSPERSSSLELTVREMDVLRLLATGLSNGEIAQRLSISAGTVRAHLSAIYSKLAVHSRTAAIHAARGHGIL